MTIVNDASTINVIDDASLALVSVANYDHKWRYNLEHHFDDTRSINYDHNMFIIQATAATNYDHYWKGETNFKMSPLTKDLREIPYFSEYSARTSIVCTLNLQWFKVEKIISQVPSTYSAQAIFDHNLLWKKVRTILDKIWKVKLN